MLVLQGLSFAVNRAVSNSDAGNSMGAVFWSLIAGVPITVLFTLLAENAIQAWSNPLAFSKVIVLSVGAISTLIYLGFSIFNYVVASKSGNVNNAVNWVLSGLIPLIIVLTLWMNNLLILG